MYYDGKVSRGKTGKGRDFGSIGSYGNSALLPPWLANVCWRCKLAMLATTMAKQTWFKRYDKIEYINIFTKQTVG